MVPEDRAETRPLGFGLTGSWISLEPRAQAGEAELRAIDEAWVLDPAMGGVPFGARQVFAEPMSIRESASGAVVGMVANQRLPGDVASFLIFLDLARGRAPHGVEATALYVSHLFDAGARLVTLDVLVFNPVNRLLQRVGLMPQARLRDHIYTAGKFWDVLVYSFDRTEWRRAISPFLDRLPGGSRRPSALGGRRAVKRPRQVGG